MKKSYNKIIGIWLLLVTLTFTSSLLGLKTETAYAATQKSQYQIKVNRVCNTVTVYKKDDKGKYTVPVKAMVCSVGRDNKTVTGSYKTLGKYRWRELQGKVWGQYATRIIGGILFHSVYYTEENNPASLETDEFNKLGDAASHGCVRLAVKDAKWIYDNCALGTTVVIYDDKDNPGPLGKPEGIKVGADVRWDPTDPDENNPYLSKQPRISGIKDCTVVWGDSFDARSGLKAVSSVGVNITSTVKVKGEVDTAIPGKYKLTYSVTDALKKSVSKKIIVTVPNNKQAPVFSGIKDLVVATGSAISADFALTKVTASCKNVKLDQKTIRVTIEKVNDSEFDVSYKASIGNGPDGVQKAKIYVDSEAPVISGVKDITMESGQIPDNTLALTGVTASDNYSSSENITIDVNIELKLDQTYLITYTATDEAGNKTVQQAICRYGNL